ncbi:hypothetical protein ACI2KR_30170 [Pseudomonas luteola]
MKKIRIASLAAIPAIAIGLIISGCGSERGEVQPKEIDAKATAYFNTNVAPLRNLPGSIYHLQVRHDDTPGTNVCIISLFIDGQVIDGYAPNAGVKLAGNVGACQFAGSHIIYTKDKGYEVKPGDVTPKEMKLMAEQLPPHMFRKYY